LVILAVHSIGIYVHPSNILNYGIPKINSDDINYAIEKGKKFKLVGQVLKIDDSRFTMFVLPKLVNQDEYIYNVENEYNGVVIEGECYDKQFMFGKGAGAYPTGSAILSDITARLHNYKYEYKKKKYFKPLIYTTNINLEIYLRYNNALDISLFDFEEISEKYSATNTNYIKGYIKLANLINIKHILPKLNIFLATTGNYR
jgi:homoserine dehydrogenase